MAVANPHIWGKERGNLAASSASNGSCRCFLLLLVNASHCSCLKQLRMQPTTIQRYKMTDNREPEGRTTTQRKTFRLQFVYTKLCYAFWHKLWNRAHIFFQIKVVLKVWIQFQRTKHAYWSSMTGRRRLSLQDTLSDSAELVAGDARHWGDGMNSSIGGNSLTKHC